MHPLRNRDGRAPRPFITAAACLALLLLVSLVASAQTKVTAERDTVADAANPQPVVLRITNADNSVNTTVAGQVVKLRVGNQDVTQLQKDDPAPGSITFTPPANLAGAQRFQLLNAAGTPLGEVQLTYPAGGGGGGGNTNTNTNRSPTPTPAQSPTPARTPRANADEDAARRLEEARRTRLTSSPWFYLFVAALFSLVLFPFVYTIYRSVRYSRSTYRGTLGLPVGSFRAILAYTLVSFLGFYILVSVFSVSDFKPPEFLLGIVATVIGFYFGSRTSDESGAEAKTGAVRGIVRLGTDPARGTEPARGAVVEFERSDDSTRPYSRITDIDGRFELRGVRPGKYKVTAKLTGSSPSPAKEINVGEGSDQEIELVIKTGGGGGGGDAATPKTGGVQGKVTKADNTPAGGASVVLSQGGAEKGTATANATTGAYKIENVAAGEYDAVATLGAASSTPVKVTVAAGGPQTLNLKLP